MNPQLGEKQQVRWQKLGQRLRELSRPADSEAPVLVAASAAEQGEATDTGVTLSAEEQAQGVEVVPQPGEAEALGIGQSVAGPAVEQASAVESHRQPEPQPEPEEATAGVIEPEPAPASEAPSGLQAVAAEPAETAVEPVAPQSEAAPSASQVDARQAEPAAPAASLEQFLATPASDAWAQVDWSGQNPAAVAPPPTASTPPSAAAGSTPATPPTTSAATQATAAEPADIADLSCRDFFGFAVAWDSPGGEPTPPSTPPAGVEGGPSESLQQLSRDRAGLFAAATEQMIRSSQRKATNPAAARGAEPKPASETDTAADYFAQVDWSGRTATSEPAGDIAVTA